MPRASPEAMTKLSSPSSAASWRVNFCRRPIVAGADHGDDGTRRGLEPALGIKKWRRRIDIGQCRGIASLAHGNEMSAGAIGCFKLGFGLSLGEDADRSAAAVTAPAVQRALPRRHQTD